MLFTITFAIVALAGPAQVPGDWPTYGGNLYSQKYTPLTQINAANFKRLKVAWRWESIDTAARKERPDHYTGPNEGTPLMVNGTLYTVTGLNQVAALNPATGKTMWSYNPKSWGSVHRGLAWWANGTTKHLFLATRDMYLVALNPANGKPDPSFGTDGKIDLVESLRRQPAKREWMLQTSPPIVCGNVVVVGSSVDDFQDQKEMPPGDIRGFDARTGKLLWTFHTIPQPGEFGHETWKEDSWKYTGAANCWTMMSADPALGFVYVPIGTPNDDWYGGHRPGAGLFGESLVCLDARTGKRVWHFQLVHHGLWDYDLPCAPVLLDVVQNGKRIKAVAQVSKQAFCYVFDRVNGKPLWPIVERPVPATPMPGDEASPTQPFPTKPAPFDLQNSVEENLINFTPELRKEAVAMLDTWNHGPLYTPPTTHKTLMLPGWVGGASWAGASADPDSGILYVPSVTKPMWPQLKRPESPNATLRYMIGESGHDPAGPKGLPLFKPPYGRITAIDLNTGDNRWMVPHGEGPRHHPAIKHLKLGPLGNNQRGYLIVTKTLLIATQEGSWFNEGNAAEPPRLRAFDKKTGKLLAEVAIPKHPTGAPMTYMYAGKQYIVIPVGGAKDPAELIAVAL